MQIIRFSAIEKEKQGTAGSRSRRPLQTPEPAILQESKGKIATAPVPESPAPPDPDPRRFQRASQKGKARPPRRRTGRDRASPGSSLYRCCKCRQKIGPCQEQRFAPGFVQNALSPPGPGPARPRIPPRDGLRRLPWVSRPGACISAPAGAAGRQQSLPEGPAPRGVPPRSAPPLPANQPKPSPPFRCLHQCTENRGPLLCGLPGWGQFPVNSPKPRLGFCANL